MASVYTNDLRLEEIGSGEQSGTWGDTTNTNLELIAEAFAFGTEAITTNADTHATTIADGATDPGRAMFLKYTGTLDSACTITIGPNTVSKLWFIENGTSGSQNIIIKQGSGATITIPPGDTKAIYSNGAGSGGAMVDAFASLSVVDLKVQDDLTVTDDVAIGGLATIGETLAVTGVLTTTAATVFNGGFASNGDSTITVDDNGNNLTLISTDTDANAGPNLLLNRAVTGANSDRLGTIVYRGKSDNGTDRDYITWDTFIGAAANGSETAEFDLRMMFAGTEVSRLILNSTEVVFNQESLDLDFRVESDNDANALFVQGSDGFVGLGIATPRNRLDFGVTSTNDHLIALRDNNTSRTIMGLSGGFGVRFAGPHDATGSGNLLEVGHIAGDGTTYENTKFAVTFAGAATIANGLTLTAGNIVMPASISHAGDADTFFGFPSANTIKFTTGNVEAFVVSTTDVVVNDSGADMNFRAESSGNPHALVVDAGTNQVLFGRSAAGLTSNGSYFANVVTTAGAHFHQGLSHTDTDAANALKFMNRQSSDGTMIEFRQANSPEGTISVSGSTVSYNGFAGRHESSGIATNTEIGTVVSTIDELDVYPDTQTDPEGGVMANPKAGQTRASHAKVKVSDSVGDNRIYGVVDNFETSGKVNITSVGIGSVRVTGACVGGDLLESNGDGTAKVQSDDIVRSKTIGKVTIGNTDTSVKLVSCVMYCG